MLKTPRGLRTQIGIFGRRNVGKSTFMNALTRQNVSIVSDVPGTTTDPVQKAMELLPLGPVLLVDTAGLDDGGVLGTERTTRTKKFFDRADVAVVVSDSCNWDEFEEDLVRKFHEAGTPLLVVFNKADLFPEPPERALAFLSEKDVPYIQISAVNADAAESIKIKLIQILPDSFFTPTTILGDLIDPGDMVVLVTPIDTEAPKGRLIMPQVQTIRDILDNQAYCTVVQERDLARALGNMKKKPALVVTDSQAFQEVAADTPDDVPLTSFSILFARYKGDLQTFVDGARSIEKLKPGDRVLVAEACTHHPTVDDIGTVKIPKWLSQHVGGELDFSFARGHDFPDDFSSFKLIIHCGGCTFNPRMMASRIMKCRDMGVPITNYGVAISYSLGIFHRALGPFGNLSGMEK